MGLDLYNDPVDGPTIRRTAMTGRPAATSPSRPRFGAGNGDPAALGANLHVPLFRFCFPLSPPSLGCLVGQGLFEKSRRGWFSLSVNLLGRQQ